MFQIGNTGIENEIQMSNYTKKGNFYENSMFLKTISINII